MFQRVVNLTVHHFLVYGRNLASFLLGVASHHRQAHHAVTQDRHLLAGFGVGAVGHLALGRFLGGSGFIVVALAGGEQCRCGHGSASEQFQKTSSVYVFTHNGNCFLVVDKETSG